MGRRGEKGAWNKPCQGAIRPDPTGTGRRRSSYGGNNTTVLVIPETAEDDLRPLTPEPESEPTAPTSAATPAPQSVAAGHSTDDATDTAQTQMSL